ncbi:hypothetical protein ACFQ3S_03360 [Mucilaginibacter terrae]|uniref:hypothetical protein n=1 Tax=Mucilaginibacter terrae TaxID=1955052 RepID=UPI003644E608
MKVTDEEKAFVRNLIWRKVKYQETFEEVYDHIITALEHHEESDLPFEILALQTLNESFMSFKSLRATERQRAGMLIWNLTSKYYSGLLSLFKFPVIFITIVAYALITYLSIGKTEFLIRAVFPAFIGLLPLILISIHHLYLIYKGKKRSVKITFFVVKASFIIPVCFNGFSNVNSKHLCTLNAVSAILSTFMIMMLLINTVNFIRLYSQEFFTNPSALSRILF